MPGTPSVSAIYKVAKQAAKGTPATTGFVTAMMTRSSVNPGIDVTQKTAEHGITYARATARKTASTRTGYLARVSYRGYLYPNAFGIHLLGNGFAVATTGAAANKTHTFTLADRDASPYLTILHTLADNEVRASDARGTRMVISGTPDGVTVEGDLVALTLGESAGSETTADEDTVGELLPTQGTLTLTYDPDGTPVEVLSTPIDTLTGVELTINNPLDENDRSIHRATRAAINQTGVSVSARLTGLPVDWDTYSRIVYADVAGSAPSVAPAIFSLAYSFESIAVIAGTAAKYSTTITIPRLELSLDDFAADGDSMITWNTTGVMLDAESGEEPITIVQVSKKASY